MTRQTFRIHGMHCTSCAMLIDMDLEDLPGVKEARTNYARGLTHVEFNSAQINVDQIVQTIRQSGYSAEMVR
jgi:copper chaperone CopZ